MDLTFWHYLDELIDPILSITSLVLVLILIYLVTRRTRS